MRLVIDANILVAELIRKRGRKLIIHPAWELYVAEKAWEETIYELNKRIEIMIAKEVFSDTTGKNLLKDAVYLAETRVFFVSSKFYSSYQNIALARIPQDPNDWQTVALALLLNAGIWTNDKDFLGCGIVTWKTETLIAYLANEYKK